MITKKDLENSVNYVSYIANTPLFLTSYKPNRARLYQIVGEDNLPLCHAWLTAKELDIFIQGIHSGLKIKGE